MEAPLAATYLRLFLFFLFARDVETLVARPIEARRRGPSQAIVFIDWAGKGTSDWSRATAKSAMMFNPEVPVYAVTDAVRDTIKDMHSECPGAKESNFHVMDLKKIQNKDKREVSFLQNYVHSSINPAVYERNCFRRFFWLRQFMKGTGVEHVLLADADILFLDNVFTFYGLTDKIPFFALSSTSTYFSYWDAQTLDDFCTYIFKFYQRPKEDLFRDIEKYGLLRAPRASAHRGRHGRSVLPGPQPQAEGWPPWLPPKQFSDMWILTAFLDGRQDLQAHLWFPGRRAQEVWKPRAVMTSLHDKTGSCYTNDNVTSREFQWLPVTSQQHRLLMPIVNGLRLPALHFQGNCKQSIVGAAKRIGIPCPAA